MALYIPPGRRRRRSIAVAIATLSWTSVAPTRPSDPTNPRDPTYAWPAGIQQAVNHARQFHMRVMLQIIGTPPWANGGKPWNWVPSNPSDFAAFASAAASLAAKIEATFGVER